MEGVEGAAAAAAGASFFLPHFRVYFSIWPAESMRRCLPVKNGWQFEQISSRSSCPLVERVVQVVPHAQWTLTVT